MPVIDSRRMLWFGLVICGLGATSLTLFSGSRAWAQSGTRQGVTPRQGSGTRATPQTTFEQRFWDYLQTAKYQNWAPLPGASADLYPGNSPHGAFIKLYVNRTAAGAPLDVPNGSILIKENYGPDQQTLMAITVMYRSQGYDPGHNDWYWVKYEPDGRVSEMSGRRVAGQVQMCAECHSGAGGDDFVFAND